MLMRSVVCVALFSLALITFTVGCSDDRQAEVYGQVTVDGQPAEKGSVSFGPLDSNASVAGATIENGKYVAAKVPVGTWRVRIGVSKVIGKKELYKNDKAESQYRNLYGESLPKKYNEESELKLDVKPGRNEKNWDLSTK